MKYFNSDLLGFWGALLGAPLPRESFRMIKKSGMLNDTIMQRPGVTELLIFENEVYIIN